MCLQRQLRAGRLVDPDNLHVTLAFLDDQPEDALEALHEELSLLQMPAFDLSLRGVGCFGGEVPRLIYADVEETESLTRLHRDVGRAIRRAGMVMKKRKFHPHVTLARLKPQDAAAVAPFLRDEVGFSHEAGTVTSVTLYESTLRPGGPTYHPLAEYDLI